MQKMYRALAGVPEYIQPEGSAKMKRSEINAYQMHIIKTSLEYWNSSINCAPYPDEMFDVDEFYRQVLASSSKIASLKKMGINIDNPKDVMDYYGKGLKKVFYTSVPSELSSIDKRKPSKLAGLIPYSIDNPNGMFKKYNYPITQAYNGISVESSKLVNKNYGTMHDMMILGDVDYESTYMPEVAFVMYPKVEIGKNGKTVSTTIHDMFESDDGEELWNWMFSKIGRKGMVALIECEL